MTDNKTKFVSNVTRRTWDLAEFEKKAADAQETTELSEKEEARRKMVVQRNPLKRRETAVDLYSKIGKFSVITNSTPLSGRGGFWCEVCECLLKDSISYLDHINGKKHQRRLGMNLRPERASVDQVRARLDAHKRKREEESDLSGAQARLDKFNEDAEAARQSKRRKTGEINEDNEDDGDSDIDEAGQKRGAASGSGSGSGSAAAAAGDDEDLPPGMQKKPKAEPKSEPAGGDEDLPPGMAKKKAAEEAPKSDTAVKTEGPEALSEEQMMMAAMGFATGFSTSKKGR